MGIGEKIMDFRKRHLLTTRQAGEIFGVSQSEISRLERSKIAGLPAIISPPSYSAIRHSFLCQ